MNKVILISIDGMRPDGLTGCGNPYVKELETAIGEWEALGYPPVHHSEEFRRRYRPAYRVIAVRYLPLLPLLAEIDGKIGASENT